MTLARSASVLRIAATLTLATVLAGSTRDARAQAQMSETEKKAAARSAYQEGVQLQEAGKYADALSRFEAAQKLFDAPTHVLHIAQCQAKTGRLVEASETYEALTRRTLAADAPEAFRQAQEQAKQELPELRPRIPTLRVTVKPDPQTLKDLRVTVNGTQMPVELLGIARPINPGTYRVNAQATGWAAAAPAETALAERDTKSVELTLTQGGAAVVVAPVPPPYKGNDPPPPPPKEEPQRPVEEGSSSFGILAGARGGAVVPAGSLGQDASNTDVAMDKFATAGGGFGIDAYLRVAKLLLLGGTFEYAGLGTPSQITGVPANVNVTATNTTTYIGAAIGVVPNIDRVSFIGDVGLGSRTLSQKLEAPNQTLNQSLTGLEFAVGAGVLIPAGKYLRIVPKAALNLGSFTNGCANNKCADVQKTAGHSFFFVGVALYFNADLGKKSGT